VTHPFHPLAGRDFEFVAYRQNWGEDRAHRLDENGQLFSLLSAGGRHGSWYVRLELPAGLDGRRRRIRRGGYPSRKAALDVLGRLRSPKAGGMVGVVTVGDWLAHWLVSRTSRAASTVRGYAAHVRLYLRPYLGEVLLTELTVGQVQAMFTAIIRQHQALGTRCRPRR
jgi:hypothetical protein